ncbi:sugar ABC transporter substrate-binding protein [Bacillus taeanensis]|uniref:Sugar ABC transporter substrate-binding protein n=1 Tax=Bacillus taeanensis TaxID=273032 RepID=A0A366XX13_9BACI|nr:sugar ABC transporter substrate-binding protein [Bacillus taeanensis]RBW70930.1 sugar ABC transporter substrate-binding protein [Bacillus taeanensis]
MTKRKLIFLIAVFFLCLLIGVTVQSVENKNKPKIVVVLKDGNKQYWKIVEAGANKAFADFQVNGKVVASPSDSEVIGQLKVLREILKQNPDALIAAPSHSSASIPIFNEYHKRDIPVLLIDSDADWEEKTTFIGTNNVELGEKGAALFGSMLQPGDKVAIITGPSFTPVFVERAMGAKKTLQAAGIEIVTERLGYNVLLQLNPVMDSILEKYPTINGVFASNDPMAIHALKSIEEKGLNIPVIGGDGIVSMIEKVESGIITATVAQNPYDMGYKSVEAALKVINGEVVEKRIDSGVDIITKDNAKDKLQFLESILE